MKGLQLNTRKRVAVLLGLGLLNACSNDQIVAPTRPVPPIRADGAGTVFGPITLATPPHNEADITVAPLGITIPSGWLIRVTVTGMLHYTVNQQRLVCQPLVPPVTPPGGLYDIGPYGFPGGNAGAIVGFALGSVILQPQDPSAGTLTGQGVASGMVYFGRSWSFPGSCGNNPQTGYQPDYLISGQQTLTIELVAPVDTLRVRIFHTPRLVAPTGITANQGRPLLNGQPWPDTLYLNVVVDSSGTWLTNRTVTLSLQSIDSGGRSTDSSYGHVHQGPQKPSGTLSPISVNTGTSGVGSVLFHAGAVSGPVVVRATSAGADSSQDTLLVRVAGLEELVVSDFDSLIGRTNAHPVNHYGIPAMVTRLNALADSFYARYQQKIWYNDMSLPYGGVFDTALNWMPPHSEHRSGRDVDVHTNGLSVGQRRFLSSRWVLLGGAPHPEATHFHLRYRGPE